METSGIPRKQIKMNGYKFNAFFTVVLDKLAY
jgi:hypothetical protein